MQSMPWWGVLLTAVGTGAIAGVILSFIKETWQKKRRVQGYRFSLGAEIDQCFRIASRYTRRGIAAPLYRLPTFFYHQALPGLLADGESIGIYPRALLLFYGEVETANRGLDRIDKLHIQMQLQADAEERVRVAQMIG